MASDPVIPYSHTASMRKTTLLVAAALVALASTQARAQQDPRFTHYYFNQLFINPAYSGLEGVSRFNLFGRSQWTGYSADNAGSPQTGLLSFNTPLLRASSGIGGVVYYETIAATTQLHASVNYAYHLNVGPGRLSFGVSPGIVSVSKDPSKYRALNPNDPNIPGGNASIAPTVGAGVYYRAPSFFVGLSGTNLNSPRMDFGGQSQLTAYTPHYYAIAGYNFEVNLELTLTPHVLAKSVAFQGPATQIEGGVMATFSNRFWAGLQYAQSEGASVLVGASLLKDNSLRVGYSLDVITSGREAKQTTSHELYLSYALPVALKAPRPAIRTPRYRK